MADGPKKVATLDELQAEFDELWRENHTWNFQAGRFHVSAPFNSMRLARYFVGFHLAVKRWAEAVEAQEAKHEC